MTNTKTDRKVFTIKIRYFKPSGKWYTDAEFTSEFRTIDSMPDSPNMNDVAAYVRGVRDSGGQGSMPGLENHGGWDGFILVDHPEAYPVLIK
jgi:hypothetical protein